MSEEKTTNDELMGLVNHIKAASEKIDLLHDISEFKVNDRVLVRTNGEKEKKAFGGNDYLIGWVLEIEPPAYVKVVIKGEENDGWNTDPEGQWYNIIDLIPNNPVTISLDFNDDGEDN